MSPLVLVMMILCLAAMVLTCISRADDRSMFSDWPMAKTFLCICLGMFLLVIAGLCLVAVGSSSIMHV